MDFAPSNTPRVKVGYFVCGRQHHIVYRGPRGYTPSTMVASAFAVLYGFFYALRAGLCEDFEWIDASYAVQDSDTFIPWGFGLPASVTGTSLLSAYSKTERIKSFTVSGRSELAKARVEVFGIKAAVETSGGIGEDTIITAGEDAATAAAIAELNGEVGWWSVADQKATFYQRATLKVNDYWLRRVRQGG